MHPRLHVRTTLTVFSPAAVYSKTAAVLWWKGKIMSGNTQQAVGARAVHVLPAKPIVQHAVK